MPLDERLNVNLEKDTSDGNHESECCSKKSVTETHLQGTTCGRW